MDLNVEYDTLPINTCRTITGIFLLIGREVEDRCIGCVSEVLVGLANAPVRIVYGATS